MRKFLLLPLLALAATAAHADDPATSVYAGAGVTSADVQNIEGTGFNIDSTSVKALAGARLFSLVGAEVDYYRLGSESRNFYFGGANASAHAFAAYAVGYLPLPILDFFAKVGLDRWQLNGNSTNASLFQFSDSGTQFAWGLGAQEHFGNFLARVEYEHLAMSNTDGAHVISLDLAYNFNFY